MLTTKFEKFKLFLNCSNLVVRNAFRNSKKVSIYGSSGSRIYTATTDASNNYFTITKASTAELEVVENQLASISDAISWLTTKLKELLK